MIVLDTHAWIWAVAEPRRLSAKARAAVANADAIGVAAISCWEVAMLVRSGRLTLDRPPAVWIAQALAQPRYEPLPLTPDIATAAGLLDGVHGDSADRLIVATARAHKARLVTKDGRLRDYDAALTLW